MSGPLCPSKSAQIHLWVFCMSLFSFLFFLSSPFLFFLFYLTVFFWKRERTREQGKRAERERERELKQTPCSAQSPMWGSISWPWDNDLIQNQELDSQMDWASQAPLFLPSFLPSFLSSFLSWNIHIIFFFGPWKSPFFAPVFELSYTYINIF